MDLKLRALLLNALSLTALRKKDVFLWKSSDQNVLTCQCEDVCVCVCVYLFISQFTIFLFPHVLFNQLDHILWLQVRL